MTQVKSGKDGYKEHHVRVTRDMDSPPLKCVLDYDKGALERDTEGKRRWRRKWLVLTTFPPEEGQTSANVISTPRLGALFMEMADDWESQLCFPNPLARSTSKLP